MKRTVKTTPPIPENYFVAHRVHDVPEGLVWGGLTDGFAENIDEVVSLLLESFGDNPFFGGVEPSLKTVHVLEITPHGHIDRTEDVLQIAVDRLNEGFRSDIPGAFESLCAA